MIKMRVTVTVEYEADPEWYGTDDPEKMAKIDEANYSGEDDNHLMELISSNKAKVTVTPILRTVEKNG